MTDLSKAAEMALEALKDMAEYSPSRLERPIDALRQALAQPEQTPTLFFGRAVYFADPKTGEKLAQPEQNSEAYGYAKRLAEAIWEKHYKEESPHWRPLHDVLGVLTQIDNMTCGLEKAHPEQEPNWWDDKEYVKNRFGAAAKVVDVRRGLPAGSFKPTSEPVKERIGEPVEKLEPVAWTVSGLITDFSRDFSAYKTKTYTVPLYTAPFKREWVGLTDEEIDSIFVDYGWCISTLYLRVVRSIEAKLKEKNT